MLQALRVVMALVALGHLGHLALLDHQAIIAQYLVPLVLLDLQVKTAQYLVPLVLLDLQVKTVRYLVHQVLQVPPEMIPSLWERAISPLALDCHRLRLFSTRMLLVIPLAS